MSSTTTKTTTTLSSNKSSTYRWIIREIWASPWHSGTAKWKIARNEAHLLLVKLIKPNKEQTDEIHFIENQRGACVCVCARSCKMYNDPYDDDCVVVIVLRLCVFDTRVRCTLTISKYLHISMCLAGSARGTYYVSTRSTSLAHSRCIWAQPGIYK